MSPKSSPFTALHVGRSHFHVLAALLKPFLHGYSHSSRRRHSKAKWASILSFIITAYKHSRKGWRLTYSLINPQYPVKTGQLVGSLQQKQFNQELQSRKYAVFGSNLTLIINNILRVWLLTPNTSKTISYKELIELSKSPELFELT